MLGGPAALLLLGRLLRLLAQLLGLLGIGLPPRRGLGLLPLQLGASQDVPPLADGDPDLRRVTDELAAHQLGRRLGLRGLLASPRDGVHRRGDKRLLGGVEGEDDPVALVLRVERLTVEQELRVLEARLRLIQLLGGAEHLRERPEPPQELVEKRDEPITKRNDHDMFLSCDLWSLLVGLLLQDPGRMSICPKS